MKTQLQHFYETHAVVARTLETAAHILPTLTRNELAMLIERNPTTWSQFANWLAVLPDVQPSPLG